MPFIESELVVQQLDARFWHLREPLVYQGERQRYTVPAGFRTDFASVPRALVWFLPRYGDYTRAAILHDYLVAQALTGSSAARDWRQEIAGSSAARDGRQEIAGSSAARDGRQDPVSRVEADRIFRRALRELGVTPPRRWMMWAAVRFASGLRGSDVEEVAQFAAVAVPSVAFIAVPAAVVQLYLVAFWLIELLFWAVARLLGRRDARPTLRMDAA